MSRDQQNINRAHCAFHTALQIVAAAAIIDRGTKITLPKARRIRGMQRFKQFKHHT